MKNLQDQTIWGICNNALLFPFITIMSYFSQSWPAYCYFSYQSTTKIVALPNMFRQKNYETVVVMSHIFFVRISTKVTRQLSQYRLRKDRKLAISICFSYDSSRNSWERYHQCYFSFRSTTKSGALPTSFRQNNYETVVVTM